MLELVQAKHAEIRALCQQCNVSELAVFGSVLTPEFSLSSDLDFLVVFHEMLPVERSEAYFGLLFGLADMFGRNVDLVVRDAIRNPYFKREVLKTAQGLYAA